MPQLADVPRGRELEDFVAAFLQSTGHFVEKNVEEANVLELDIVATTYGDGVARRLFEVKEGTAQFSDIFKVLGWMTYLGIERGAFVTARASEHKPTEFFRSRCEQVGMDFIVIDDLDSAASVFEAAGYGAVDETLHALWRYSMWVERNLMRALRRFARDNPSMQAPKEALNYYSLINNGVFLATDTVDRISKLYAAYQTHPRLTAGAARELNGGAFDAETLGEEPLIREALWYGRHLLLQVCMYLEHRARLSILKAAVDYLAEGGVVRDLGDGRIRIDFRAADLPQSFLNGFTKIGNQPRFELYPLFWQLFLWGWGGLLLSDRLPDDRAGLAAQSGLNEEDLDQALGAFDWLFPIDRGWIGQTPTAAYRFVKMMPWPFQGLGAWYRLMRAEVGGYEELLLRGQYTTSDLANRHNTLVRVLDADFDF
ncbi:MAG: hypothetical protein ACJ752_04590 [Gaiellaceae bacterium]